MSAETRRRGILTLVLGVAGVVLLLAALGTGWYQISFSARGGGASQSATETFLPGAHYQYALGCSGNGSYCGGVGSSTGSQSYTQGRFNSTGSLYESIEGLLVAGAAFGLLSVAFAAAYARGRIVRRRLPVALLVIALVCAFAAPLYVAAAQPAAIAADFSGSSGNGPSPSSSFSGSCSGTGCGAGIGSGFSGSWGPAIGWYLTWVAFAVFAGAIAVLLFPSRTLPASLVEDSASTTPPTAPAEPAPAEFWQDPPTE